MQKSGWPLSWQRRGGKREYFYRGFRLEMIYLSSAHDMMWHWGIWRGERVIDCSRLASRREAIGFIDTLLKTPDHYECPRCDQVVLVNGTYGIEHRHQCIDLIANNTNQSVEKVASWRTNDHREGA